MARKTYKLFLKNDSKHSFQEVLTSLMLVCGHTPYQAENCLVIANGKGECLIKLGPKGVINDINNSLTKLGFKTRIEK